MFSQTSEYALRVITLLAADPDRPATNARIAEVTKVPPGYLYKILNTLERAGLVRSQRGKHGGYSLDRPSSKISVFDVIQVVEPLPRIKTCPLHLRSHGIRLCPLHKKLDNAFALIEESLRDALISDLLADRTASIPLCDQPTEQKRRRSLPQLSSKSR